MRRVVSELVVCGPGPDSPDGRPVSVVFGPSALVGEPVWVDPSGGPISLVYNEGARELCITRVTEASGLGPQGVLQLKVALEAWHLEVRKLVVVGRAAIRFASRSGWRSVFGTSEVLDRLEVQVADEASVVFDCNLSAVVVREMSLLGADRGRISFAKLPPYSLSCTVNAGQNACVEGIAAVDRLDIKTDLSDSVSPHCMKRVSCSRACRFAFLAAGVRVLRDILDREVAYVRSVVGDGGDGGEAESEAEVDLYGDGGLSVAIERSRRTMESENEKKRKREEIKRKARLDKMFPKRANYGDDDDDAEAEPPAEKCTVCWEPLEHKKRGLLIPCGHATFCLACAKDTFVRLGQCPLDRAEIASVCEPRM